MITRESLLRLDNVWARAGIPKLSRWWLDNLTAFYGSPCKQLVLRVGRRGGKSSTLAKIAVAEAILGSHKIPPHDVGVVAFVSVNRYESAERLRTIAVLLKALNVPFKQSSDSIELEGKNVAFRTFAATVGSVSGFTCICAIGDELAKWSNAEDGSNPAKEVIASLRPTMATMPNARLFLSSSPWSTTDEHHSAFESSDGVYSLAFHATSWEANPTLDEQSCWELSGRDQRTFDREFRALPVGSTGNAFAIEAFDRCLVESASECAPMSTPVLVVDASAGRGDAFTFCLATWSKVTPKGRPELWYHVVRLNDGTTTLVPSNEIEGQDPTIVHAYASPIRDEQGDFLANPAYKGTATRLLVHDIDGFAGKDLHRILGFDEVVARIAERTKRYGVTIAIGDQLAQYALESEFRRHGIKYIPQTWGSTSKQDAVVRLRQLLREQILAIEKSEGSDRLRKELQGFEEKVNASGSITYGARRSGHDDFVALLLNIALGDTLGNLKGSPIRKSFGVAKFDAQGNRIS